MIFIRPNDLIVVPTHAKCVSFINAATFSIIRLRSSRLTVNAKVKDTEHTQQIELLEILYFWS